MQLLQTPVQLGLTAIWLIASVFVLIRGGSLERIAMTLVIVASLASPFVQDFSRLHAPQWGLMAVDGVLFLALAAMTWRYDKPWLPWAAGFQLMTVVTHVGKALNPDILGRAYLSTSYLLFVGLLAALIWGTVRRSEGLRDGARTAR